MNKIKNLNLLNGKFTLGQVKSLDVCASHFTKDNRIEFKILSANSNTVTVRCVQNKIPDENYLDQKDLIVITKSMFNQVLPDCTIIVHAIVYTYSVVEVVTSEWIEAMMFKHKVSLKILVTDTGIDKTSLSALINGLKPLSQGMKAMFYYYFLSKS